MAPNTRQGDKEKGPPVPEGDGNAAENPTDASEKSNNAPTDDGGTQASRDEEMLKMRKELEELRASLQRLASLSGGRVGESSKSIEKEYERTARYNLREDGTHDPYRKPSLREPPTFDGTELKANPYALRLWLRDVFEYVTLNFPNDEQSQVRYAMRLLRKGAETGTTRWANRLKEEGKPLTMAEWATNLKRLLQPKDPAERAQREWVGASMREDEDAYQYFLRLESYAESMNAAEEGTPVMKISDETLSAHYRCTLKNKLQNKMTAHMRILNGAGTPHPKHSWEYLHLAIDLEQELKDEQAAENRAYRQRNNWKRGRGATPPKATVEQTDRIPIDAVHQAIPKKLAKKKKVETRTCYRCQEPGHIAVNCPKNDAAPGPKKTNQAE